jgi:NAD-dependent deacetylase
MEDMIRSAADMLRRASKVVALTGAGISKESGIATFRDEQTGLWANYNPEELATPSAFKRNPGLVWRWYDMRRQKIGEVHPNPGHYALVELEKQLKDFLLVTQNIDGLHTQAGSRNVIELHGNIRRNKCFEREHAAVDVPFGLEEPPTCTVCGSLVRPDVVWFEEAMPERELKTSFRASEACDVMLVIGTSALVQPAASLPIRAKQARAKLIEVNPTTTPLTDLVDMHLSGPSGEILPQIVSALVAR